MDDTAILALIIAISGTTLYQLRTYNKQSLKNILTKGFIGFAASTTASYTILANLPSDITGITYVGLVLGQIAAIAGITAASTKIASTASKKVGIVPRKKSPLKDMHVEYLPKDSYLQSNLVSSETGAILPKDSKYLWIKVRGVKSYIAVVLKDDRGNAIQVEQSHDADQDNDVETVRLEMFKPNGDRLAAGKYSYSLTGDRGTSYYIGAQDNWFTVE